MRFSVVLVVALGTLIHGQDKAKTPELCTVSGQVVSAATGEPLKSARLSLAALEQKDEKQGYQTVTDGDGHFTVSTIPPGRYRFLARHNGFVPQEYRPDATSHSGAILELNPGQKLDKVLFRLTRAGVIVGRITDEDGQPAAGVEVQALVQGVRMEGEDSSGQTQKDVAALAEAVSNDLGEYRLYGLPPGSYYVVAIDSGIPELSDSNLRGGFSIDWSVQPISNHPPMYFPGVTERSQAQKLKVGAGQELRADMELRPAKILFVSGRVIGVDGKPAAKAYVRLRSESMEAMASSLQSMSVADDQGRFEIKGVMPGAYTVEAWQNEASTRYSAEQRIDIASDNLRGIVVHLGTSLGVRGRVSAPAGSALNFRGMDVWLSPVDRSPHGFGATQVKEDGHFKVDGLRRTKYALSLTGLPDGWYLKSATFGDGDVLNQGLHLEEGEAGHTLELTIVSGAAELHGTVVQGENSVPGATVELTPEHQNPYHKIMRQVATTDQHGGFLLKNLVPGSYLIKAVVGDDDELESEEADRPTSSVISINLAEHEFRTVRLEITGSQP